MLHRIGRALSFSCLLAGFVSISCASAELDLSNGTEPEASSDAAVPSLRIEEKAVGLLTTDVMTRKISEAQIWDWVRTPERDNALAFSTTEVPGSWEGNFGLLYEPIGTSADQGTTATLTHVIEYDLQAPDGSRSLKGTWSEDRVVTLGGQEPLAARLTEPFNRTPGTVSLRVLDGEEPLLEKTMRIRPVVESAGSEDILESAFPTGETYRIIHYGKFGASPEGLIQPGRSDPTFSTFLDDIHFQGTTSEVPLDKDVWWGFYFRLESAEGKQDVPYIVRVHHPEAYNPFRRVHFSMRDWELETMEGNYGFALLRNDQKFKQVPGTYRFEVWVDQQLVLRKSFEVYETESGGM